MTDLEGALRRATYARAYSLSQDGLSAEEIGEQLHVSAATAAGYVNAGRPVGSNAPTAAETARPCLVCRRPWDDHLVREWRLGCKHVARQ